MSVVVSSCHAGASSAQWLTAGRSSKPVPGVLVVASRGSSVAVRLVRVLVGVLVILLHQRRVVPAVLGARGHAVAILPRSLVVVVLVGGHQAAAFDGGKVRRVVAVSVSLGLFERGYMWLYT